MKVCCKKIFIFIFTKIPWALQLRGWRYTYFPFNFRSIDQLASVEEIWEWNFICNVLLLARFFKCIIVFHMITIFSMMNSLFLNVLFSTSIPNQNIHIPTSSFSIFQMIFLTLHLNLILLKIRTHFLKKLLVFKRDP